MSGRTLAASATACLLALAAGNFLWAALSSTDFVTAAERSFFQAVALFVFCRAIRDEVDPR